MKRDIPDFLVEQLLLGELDPRVKEELLKEPEVIRRLDNLRASNAEILEAYPAGEMGRRIEDRLRVVTEAEERVMNARSADVGKAATGQRSARLRHGIATMVHWKGFIPAVAAATALALVIGFAPLLSRGGVATSNPSEIRVKGAGPVLHVYRETKNGAELLHNGAQATAHDLLQLSYIAEGAQYGIIFSVDGSGTVTLHYPERSRIAARLEGGGEIALPYSYELDNAPRFERFYLVTSSNEFPVDEILNVARKAATAGKLSSITFPKGFAVSSFTVDKETK